MRKTILYIAMSLDGYIADKNGGVAWLEGDGGESENVGSYDEFISSVDTIILGNTTYQQVTTELSPGNWPYKDKKTYVITHAAGVSTDEIEFTNKSPDELVRELQKKVGKDIWICGGADIVNQVLGEDLIDRFHITVIPVILGDGIRLFSHHERATELRLISTKSYNGMTDLVYERRK